MTVMPDFDNSAPTQEEVKAAELDIQRRLVITKASEVTISRVAYLWEGRIPLGAITIMPGEEGIGKTTVGIRLMADLTNGKLDGEYLGQPKSVLVLSAEDGISDIMVPRFAQAGADLGRVLFVRGIFDPLEGSISDGVVLPRDLECLARTIREEDAALVWVDSLVTTLPAEMKSISYQDTSTALRAIGAFAEREHVSVVAPWHLNKSGGAETASRMMDSRAYRSATRSVLVVVPAESESGQTEGLVILDKANGGPLHVSPMRFCIRSAPYTVHEGGREITSSCGVVEWMGPEEGDGRELARAALSPRVERRKSPTQTWLEGYLHTNGETERKQVMSDAMSEMGFQERAVDRAATALQVVRRELTGRNEVSGAPWRAMLWSLRS